MEYVIYWLIIGFVSTVLAVLIEYVVLKTEDKFTVQDLGMFLALSALGLISLIALIGYVFNEHGKDIVLWERKTKLDKEKK